MKVQKEKYVSVFPSHLSSVSVCPHHFFKSTVGPKSTYSFAACTSNFSSQALSCTRLFSCKYACYLSSLGLDRLGISNYVYILNSREDFPCATESLLYFLVMSLEPWVRDLTLRGRVMARLQFWVQLDKILSEKAGGGSPHQEGLWL